MFDALLRRPSAHDDSLATPLAEAAAAMARLDQALAGCPLTPAFLYRAGLDALPSVL